MTIGMENHPRRDLVKEAATLLGGIVEGNDTFDALATWEQQCSSEFGTLATQGALDVALNLYETQITNQLNNKSL